MTVTMLSVLLAAILGFSAHRASLCTVRAIAEVLSTGRACMLWSIAKSVFWVLAVTVALVHLLPGVRGAPEGWPVSTMSILGGFLFGVGATVNGGCAFSTLAQLADGRLRMILTVGGFCLGAFAMLELLPGGAPAPAVAGPVRSWSGWWALAAVALSVWAVRETVRLWRSRPPGRLFRDLPFSERYRLSTAAALIGLSNGVLNFLFGSWSHTGTFLQAMEGLTQKNAMPSVMKWILLVALFGGMVFSTWQRRGFRLDWRPSFVWWRNLVGGLAMGGGAVLVPGGNDTLVLQGIPGLSAHALPAYLAMLIGIATSLLAMRWIARTQMIVDCSNDICISREESRRRRPSFPSGAIGTIKPDDGSFSRIRPRPSSNGDLSKRSIRGRGRR